MDHVFKDALLVKEAQILQSSTDAILVRIARAPAYDRTPLRIEREFRARLGREIRSTSRRSTRSRARRTASSAR